jgi:soluble lytic murein transglycosylase-like protein
VKQTQQGKEIFQFVEKYSEQYKVDSKFVHSVILVESGYNPNATSPCGAKGLMQLMPATFNARKVGTNPYSIEQNIHAGVKHIAGLQAKYKGNMYLVASAYNAGGGAVDRSLQKYGKIPRGTEGYVYKVQSYKQFITF